MATGNATAATTNERDLGRGRRAGGIGLPVQLTSFVGRDDELAKLEAFLGGSRLMTLTGAGGCGKTRLALRVAADVAGRFPDGVCWVDLVPVTDPGLVAGAVLEAMGMKDDPASDPLWRLAGYLGDGSALVCLDNCEHLVEGCARVADELLRRCPGVTVLATSREALGVDAETAWRVPPLSAPPADEAAPARAAMEYDAVRLFVERAGRVRPDFALTDDNAAEVARICRRLDGIPLAIELAAARVRVLATTQIASALDDRFRLLTGGARTAVARHRTLLASMQWSHELLSEPERAVFRRLSVFSGGFPLEGAERVVAGDGVEAGEVLDLLAHLVDKSLVIADEAGAARRFRMLETVRAYAADRLGESDEDAPTRDRHLEWVLEVAETMEPAVEASPQAGPLAVLDQEHDNIRAALEWAEVTGNVEPALRLVGSLALFWQHRGHAREALAWFERALAAGPAAPGVRAKALWGLGHVSVYAGDVPRAMAAVTDARGLARQAGDAGTEARALKDLGMVSSYADVAAGREVLAEAVALARAAGDRWCLTDGLQLYAWTWIYQDDYPSALPHLDEAAALAREADNRYLLAWDHVARLNHAWRLGDLAAARRAGEAAVEASRQVAEPSTHGAAMFLLPVVMAAQGEHRRAVAAADEALTELRHSHALMVPEGPATSRAIVQMLLGEPDAADAMCAGVDTLTSVGVPSAVGIAAGWCALGARHAHDPDRAAEMAELTKTLAASLANLSLAATADHVAGLVALDAGSLGRAEQLLHAALALRCTRGSRLEVVDSLEALAQLSVAAGSDAEAVRLLGAAAAERGRLGYVRFPIEQPWWDGTVSLARARLGAGAFDAAWDEGSGLDVDAAVRYTSRARGERKRPTSGWASLTPTELEIAKLVAQGLTNPTIGVRLFISRGTVKTHLAHVYAKLGINSRAELAAQAARRDL